MAGISRPSPISNNLKKEAQYNVLSVVGSQGSGGTIASCGLFNGVNINEWNTANVMYWQTSAHYVEINITSPKVNIWRSGTTDWTGNKAPLIVMQWNGSDYVDVTSTYPQTLTSITQAQWEKTISNLPMGKYKFVGTGARLDSEWYIEDANSSPIFKICNDINSVSAIGDVIPCRYTAQLSGYVGILSELGTCIANEIPVAGSATPDGLFYWIYVGKDYLGRKKFIADRNIQHSISWDTLNNVGIASERDNKLDFSNPLVPVPFSAALSASTGIVLTSSALYAGFNMYTTISNGSSAASLFATTPTVALPHWLGISFPTPKSIIGYRINGPGWDTYSSARAPKDWKVEATYADNTVEIIQTVTNQTNWGQGEIRYFKLNISKPIKMIRILASATNGDTLLGFGVQLFEDNNISKNNNITLRLPTGGTSATDTDNEWDKILVNSTLNNKITKGDDNIWHWSNIYSWVSTSLDSSHRGMRGATSSSNFRTVLDIYSATSGVLNSIGFRPVMLVEQLFIDKYLIKKDSNYYSILPAFYDAISHNFTPLNLTGIDKPNKADVELFGFDDLNLLLAPITKGSDTIKPIDKFDNCEIKYYTTT